MGTACFVSHENEEEYNLKSPAMERLNPEAPRNADLVDFLMEPELETGPSMLKLKGNSNHNVTNVT